ncbi:LOW QUALITY PROTEIN: HS12A-like protein [Mya arenaria]|uniref:HS12A-like protein n=1 Tax=Mya arenaria TaxID=6604 RepID=A0ABY7G2C0_MYAAR|nr:LOW QUALITY PROTEIN: HS12A-like protein [Mya arenaria]
MKVNTQVDAIVEHVINLIDQSIIGDIAAVILVGGFSNCPLLQQAMRTKFDKHTNIVPNDPELAVLKGALIFRHKPELISHKYTYGTNKSAHFIEHVHRESYKVKYENGDAYCEQLFDKHITAWQCLNVGEAQSEQGYTPFKSSLIAIQGSGLARFVRVRMIYGGTEIEVEATEVATGKVHRLRIDFLR